MPGVIETLLELLGVSDTPAAANQAQVVSAAIASVTAVVALAAAALVLFQVRATRAIQREAVARQMYNEYLRLCFAESMYAAGNWSSAGELPQEVLFEKYEWFVSVMLNACESILLHVADRDEWRETIRSQIGFHSKYIKSERFQREYACHYSDALRSMFV